MIPRYIRIAMLSLALLVLLVPPSISTSNALPLQRFDGYSANWGGYTIVVGGEITTTATGNLYWDNTANNPIYSYTVSYVYGEWNVPAIKPGTTGFMGDVSVWVGIDGYSSGTVEQLGTSSEYNPSTGQITYSAWWEMYPKFSHRISAMSVNPGDDIKASVQFIPTGSSAKNSDRGNFVLSLTDTTTGKSFTTTQGPLQPGFYQRSSAEWIVERAAFYDTKTKQAYFAELPEFDTPVAFTNCKSTVTTPSSAPINYDRMWIRAPYPSGLGYGDAYGTSLTRYTIATTTLRDGTLITGGSFTVSWVPYGTLAAGAWPYTTPEGHP